MPPYKYIGEDSRFFPTCNFGKYLEPGDEVEADENPDVHRFELVPFGSPVVDPVPAPPVAEPAPTQE